MLKTLENQTDEHWSHISTLELIGFLKQDHQVVMDEKIPELKRLLDEVLKNVAEPYKDMLIPLKDILVGFTAEKIIHIKREEEILFSYIEQLEYYVKGRGPEPQTAFTNMENPISLIEHDHNILEHALLEAMSKIASTYKLFEKPSDAFESFYNALKSLEAQFMKHMHLEIDILFPKAIELEMNVKHGRRKK